MKRLVYAICRKQNLLRAALPLGLDGRPVASIATDDLAAVCSEAPAAVAPDISSVRVYARVIEALHQHCTILPLRWGCVLDSPAQVEELLCRRHDEFKACLRRVEGCMEMGLRIRLSTADPCSSVETASLASGQAAPGTAYLQRCRLHYAKEDTQRQAEAVMLVRLSQAFGGLFVQSAAAPVSSGPARQLSVAFLVHRAQGEAFRQAFERLRQRRAERMFLTGPWPPYSFATGNAQEPHL